MTVSSQTAQNSPVVIRTLSLVRTAILSALKVTSAVQMVNGHAALATAGLSRVETASSRMALARRVLVVIDEKNQNAILVLRHAVRMEAGLVRSTVKERHMIAVMAKIRILPVSFVKLKLTSRSLAATRMTFSFA
jgi:hypothetical protein